MHACAGDVFPYPNYFHNITGSNDYDNFARTDAPADFSFYYSFLQQPSVRKAIHVGDHPYNSGHECEWHGGHQHTALGCAGR